ncbi:MAG: MBL fold metallo-hydrolase [Caldilinea sp. CFX5]|nr:MBL fold metallo-hydrolase [Caldilinea sp. CFX5]
MSYPIQIPLPIPYAVGPVNSYLFIEPEPTLIDCGVKSDDSWHALVTALDQYQLTIADLRRVIITHAHVDHMGMAGKIAAHSSSQIWVAAMNYDWAVHLPQKWQRRMAFMGSVIRRFGLSEEQQQAILGGMARTPTLWDVIPAERVVTFPVDGVIAIGGQPWQVIYTPGHSNTQTCFYQPESRQFLAADMLLPVTPTPVIEEPLDGSDERLPGLPLFLASLALVEALDIDQVYPGHGDIFTDHRALIQRQRTRIHQRKEECYALICSGRHTFAELFTAMYGQHPYADRFSALGMLVGYLDLLVAEQAVTVWEENRVYHYGVQP